MISKKVFLVYFKFIGKQSRKPTIISPTLEDENNVRMNSSSSLPREQNPVRIIL